MIVMQVLSVFEKICCCCGVVGGIVGIGSCFGFFIYGFFVVFIIGSVYLFWWLVVVVSGMNVICGEMLFFIFGGNFFVNVVQVFDVILFWLVFGNLFLILGIIMILVVIFLMFVGYVFVKLWFKGCDGLMIFVIVMMVILMQLGIILLFMLMCEFGWIGFIGVVIVFMFVIVFGVFFMWQYLVDVILDELIEVVCMDGVNQFCIFLIVGFFVV